MPITARPQKTENNKFGKVPLPLPFYKLTEIVVLGFRLSKLVQQMQHLLRKMHNIVSDIIADDIIIGKVL